MQGSKGVKKKECPVEISTERLSLMKKEKARKRY